MPRWPTKKATLTELQLLTVPLAIAKLIQERDDLPQGFRTRLKQEMKQAFARADGYSRLKYPDTTGQ